MGKHLRVINGLFPFTKLSGCVLSSKVREAMNVDSHYDLIEVEQWAGEQIAEICHAEAATVTSGAYAGLVQCAASLIKGERNRFTVQKCLRTRYDSAIQVGGGKIVEETLDGYYAAAVHHLAGGQGPWWLGTEPWMLWRINPSTSISLPQLREAVARVGVPLLVDAAGQSYPLEGFREYSDCGLAVYAGKYFGAPMNTGFIVGHKGLVEKTRQQGTIGFEKGFNGGAGRGYKVDIPGLFGVVTALQEWMRLDHWEQRARPAYGRAKIIWERLHSRFQTSLIPKEEQHIIPFHRILLAVDVPSPVELQRQLALLEPSIRVDVREGQILINCLTLLNDWEAEHVAQEIWNHVK